MSRVGSVCGGGAWVRKKREREVGVEEILCGRHNNARMNKYKQRQEQ